MKNILKSDITKFHGKNKIFSFFEGWYFKHENNNETICFIPGISIDKYGRKKAFIQIITNENSYNIDYPYKQFKVHKNKFCIKIGNNIFSKKGIKIDINNEDISIKGKLLYGKFTPIEYDIMGIFKLIPFMECNHGIISLNHSVIGTLNINNKNVTFNTGYIEKDWGHSFPKKYLWLQCNNFQEENTSIMVSIAQIPLLGLKFEGCICVVYYKGKEYRLATYEGVESQYTNNRIVLKQDEYCLDIKFKDDLSHELFAPKNGGMSTKVSESLRCNARFRFYIEDELIFDFESDSASLESSY